MFVSGKAARRLRLLQVPLPVPSGAAGAAALDGSPPGLLAAALLTEPSAPTSGEWQRERDLLAELAVTLDTLRLLQAGAVAQRSSPAASACF